MALTRAARVRTADELQVVCQRDDESIEEQGGVAALVKSSIDDDVVDATCKVAMNQRLKLTCKSSSPSHVLHQWRIANHKCIL